MLGKRVWWGRASLVGVASALGGAASLSAKGMRTPPYTAPELSPLLPTRPAIPHARSVSHLVSQRRSEEGGRRRNRT